MKIKLLLISATAILFAACSDAGIEESVGFESTAVTFTPSIAATSRVSSDLFDDGDEILVTALKESSLDSFATNVSYTFNSDEDLFSSTNTIYNVYSQELIYRAVYPAVSNFADTFTFSAQSDQSSKSGYEMSDLLISQSEATSDLCPTLIFKHKMSSLVINFTASEAVSDVVIYAKGSADVDLTNDTYTASGSSAAITPASLGDQSITVLFAPQTITAGDLVAEFTIDGTDYTWVANNNLEFASGYRYTYSWNAETLEMTLDSYIDGWSDLTLLMTNDDEIMEFECEYFKDYLVNYAMVDTDGDGEITYGEAKAYTGAITLTTTYYASSYSITSLAEVKYFPNISSINLMNASNTALTDIDLTYNTSVTSVIVTRSNLTGEVILPGAGVVECPSVTGVYIQTVPALVDIDLTMYPNLNILFCGSAYMKSLVVPSSLTKLYLTCGTHEDFKSVDISECASLATFQLTTASYTNYMTELDLSNNTLLTASGMTVSSLLPNLEKLTLSSDQWDDGANAATWASIFDTSSIATNPLFAIYVGNTQVSADREMTLSDSALNEAAIADSSINTNGDDVLTANEVKNFAGTLTVPDKVTSLSDLQYFTSLTGINLDACTTISSVNLSEYETLTSISAQNDTITTLVIPTSTTSLALGGGLTTLDLSGATDLAASAVSATSASITALTLNQTQAAAGEDGTTLTTLETLADAIMAAGSEISVIQDSGSTYIYTYVTDTVAFKGEMPVDAIAFADANFEAYIFTVGNMDGTGSVVAPAEGAINNDPADYYIGMGEAAAYTGKLVIPSNVASLSDLSYFTNITAIDLSDYTGTSANLTANTALKTVTATGANLATLTLPASVATLDIEGSKVAVLDISANTSMTKDDLTAGAQLTQLTLPSGYDASEWTGYLVASGASTIIVDGVVTVYVDGAEDTSAPYTFTNSTFETYVKTLSGIDANYDGTISEAEVATYAGELVLPNTVTSVTGDIEMFTAITKFDAALANITDVTLDLSNAPNVTYIALMDWNMTITTLLLPDTDKLETLDVEYGRITSLNLKDRKALKTLSCGSHYLAELDVTGCTNLETLNLRATATTLTELDLTDLTSLTAFGSGNWSNLSVKVVEMDFSNTQLTVANFVTVGNTVYGTSLSYLEVLKLNETQQAEGIANWGAKIPETATIQVDNGATYDVNGNEL